MLSIGISGIAQAQEEIIVKVNNSEVQVIEIDKIRKLTFPDGNLKIESNKGDLLFSTPISEIMLILSRDEESSIEPVETDNFTAYQQNGFLYITTEEKPNKIEIINLQGQTIHSIKDAGRAVTIPISDLAQGTYLLRIDHTILKFIKK